MKNECTAGRKADDGAIETRKVSLSLDEETIALFTEIGGGNMSLGARRLAQKEATDLHSATQPTALPRAAVFKSSGPDLLILLPLQTVLGTSDEDARLRLVFKSFDTTCEADCCS